MNRKEMQQMNYEKNHKEIDEQLYKRCSIHKEYSPNEEEWLLCTDEYFYKNKGNSDGLSPYCKVCEKKKSTIYNQAHNDQRYWYNKKYLSNPENLNKINKSIRERRQRDGKFRGWQQNNKDKIKQYQENRKQHGDHKITKKEWESCKEYFNNQCAYCGLPIEEHYIIYKGERKLGSFHKEHVDHKGENDLSNCVPSCKECNSSKHDVKLENWYTETNQRFNQERLDKIHKWLDEDYKLYYIEPKPKRKYTKKDSLHIEDDSQLDC